MSQTYSHLPSVSQSSELRDLSVSINGVQIKQNDILDLQINFGEDRKHGAILINDLMSYGETLHVQIGEIFIHYTDIIDTVYEENFVITEAFLSRDKNNKPVIDIRFEDLDTFVLRNTFVNYHYQNKTPAEILGDILVGMGLNYSIYDGESSKTLENVVIPKDNDLFNWMKKFVQRHGLYIIKDKYISYIIHKDLLLFKNLPIGPELEFNMEAEAENFRRIMEYDQKMVDRYKTSNIPVSEIQEFDIQNSVIKPEQQTISEVYQDEVLNNGSGIKDVNFEDQFFSIGTRSWSSLVTNYESQGEESYHWLLDRNQELEIYLPGINMDRVMYKYMVRLPRSAMIEEFDKTYSGYYVCTKTIDKISNSKLFNVLTMNRSDYGEGEL